MLEVQGTRGGNTVLQPSSYRHAAGGACDENPVIVVALLKGET